MSAGKVNWFSDAKGYGFIESAEDQRDVFVHYSDISGDGLRSLDEGAAVEFELEPGTQGDRARNVVRVQEA
ncbi:MAG: cold-shock protein [Planctomycetota bacterium]|nr:MAG: cold-shock protein [Planctomycetota bacterium]